MISIGENLLQDILRLAILDDEVIYNCRNLGLVNAETKNPLEIDIYYPKYKLAYEFQGEQHFNTTAFADEETVAKIQARDKAKSFQCKMKGITLVVVNAKHLHVDKIRYRLNRNKLPLPLIEADENGHVLGEEARTLNELCARYIDSLNKYENHLSHIRRKPQNKYYEAFKK